MPENDIKLVDSGGVDVFTVDPSVDEYINSDPVVDDTVKEKRLGSWLADGNIFTFTPSALYGFVPEQGDAFRLNQARSLIENPEIGVEHKAQQLGEIAQRMGSRDYNEATLGMAQTVAGVEEKEQLPSYLKDLGVWLERQDANLESAKSVFQSSIAEIKDTTLEIVSGEDAKILGSTELAAAAAAGLTTLGAVSSFVLPTYQIELTNIIKKYAPEFNWGDYFTDGNVNQAFRTAIQNAPSDEVAAQMAKDAVNAIRDTAGHIFSNNYEKVVMVEELLSAVDKDGPNFIDEVFNFIDVVSLVPVAGGVVKLGAKASVAAVGGAQVLIGARAAARQSAFVENVVTQTKRLVQGDRAAKKAAEDVELDDIDLIQKEIDESLEGAFKELDDLEAAAKRISFDLDDMVAASKKKKAGEKLTDEEKALATIKDLDDMVASRGLDGPQVPVGTPADAVISTLNGAKRAVTALNEKPLPPGSGVFPEDVIGSLVVPKLLGTRLDTRGRPFIESHYLSDDVKKNIKDRVFLDLSARLQNRLHNMEIGELNGITVARSVLGGTNGRGFASEANAKKALNEYFPDEAARVTEKDGQWWIEMESAYVPTLNNLDVEEKLMARSGFWRQYFGKNGYISDHLRRMEDAALQETEKAGGEARDLILPFTNLRRSHKARVGKALWEGALKKTWWEEEDLAQFGINTQSEIEAYNSIVELAKLDLSTTNFRLRETLISDGYKSIINMGNDDGGVDDVIVRVMDEGEKPGVSAKLIDSETGRTVDPKAVNEEDLLLKAFEPTGDGATHIVVRKGAKNSAARLQPLPAKIIKDLKGYYGMRRYSYPYYVRKIKNGRTTTVAGARSIREGQEYIERHRGLLDEGEEFVEEPQLAQELAGGNVSEASRMTDEQIVRSRSLMYNSHRKTDLLDDAANRPDGQGNPLPMVNSPEEAVYGMIVNFANNSGMARYRQAVIHYINRHYGDRLGIKFDLTQSPRPTAKVEQSSELGKLYNEAASLLRHIQRNAGMSPDIGEKTLNTLRLWVAKKLWKTDIRSFQWAGDNISGLNPSAQVFAKTATFGAYLGTNILRQLPLQTSMIPTYFGVDGAASYLGKGDFFQDFLTILMSKMGVRGMKFANSQDKELVEAFQNSGLDGLVHNHLYATGTVADGSLTPKSAGWDAALKILNGAKAVGFDQALQLENMVSWLLARKRFAVRNGRLPRSHEDWQDVFSQSRMITMNQNRSDLLPYNNGTIGILTQFWSHQMKYTNRLMFQELGLSKAERLRVHLLGLMSYGFDYLRMGDLVDSWEEKTGYQVPPQFEEILKQGSYGSTVNATLRYMSGEGFLLDDEEADKQGQIAWSAELSPGNFAGSSLQNVLDVIEDIGELAANSVGAPFDIQLPSISSYEPYSSFSPPAIALGADMLGLGSLAFKLMWGPQSAGIGMGEGWEAWASEAFRTLPVTGQLMRGIIAFNMDVHVDSNGNLVAPATTSEAIGALMGINPTDVSAMSEELKNIYGAYEESSKDGRLDAIRNKAKEDARFFAQALNGFAADGDIADVPGLIKKMDAHIIAMNGVLGMSKIQLSTYISAFKNEVLDSKVLKSERLAEKWMEAYQNHRFNYGSIQQALNHLRAEDWPGAKDLADTIQQAADMQSGVLEFLEGK